MRAAPEPPVNWQGLLGYLNFSDNKLDPQTGTLKARGVFANPPQMLLPPAPLGASLAGS